MKHIPTALRELADSVEQVQPFPVPQKELKPCDWPMLQVMAVTARAEEIFDYLQFHKSVEYADAFMQRVRKLQGLADKIKIRQLDCEDEPEGTPAGLEVMDAPDGAQQLLLLETRIAAEYFRSLANAIEREESHAEAASDNNIVRPGQAAVGTHGDGGTPKGGDGQPPIVDLDIRACACYVIHPEWTMTTIAQHLPCSRPHLYRLPKLGKLRGLLKSGKFNLPAGTKSSDGTVEAFKNNPDARTCPACRDPHEFACPACDDDDLHCPVCHIELRHSTDVTD